MIAESRADFCCPECDSSDVHRDGAKVFECRQCGERVHEAVEECRDSLERLADRDDDVGWFARRVLDTGGVSDE